MSRGVKRNLSVFFFRIKKNNNKEDSYCIRVKLHQPSREEIHNKCSNSLIKRKRELNTHIRNDIVLHLTNVRIIFECNALIKRMLIFKIYVQIY